MVRRNQPTRNGLSSPTKYMRYIVYLILGFGIVLSTQAQTNTETIVCIRHGEKPVGGLGQLNCQGLNRALALPDILVKKFGKPNYIFAPNPTQKADTRTNDGYNYIRPLMTIEPTAIKCGLPVDTSYGFKEISALQEELLQAKYKNATIFVAWEHGLLDQFAKQFVQVGGGNPQTIPNWPGTDFDTIFIFKVTRLDSHIYISFTTDHEGLNGLSTEYPRN